MPEPMQSTSGGNCCLIYRSICKAGATICAGVSAHILQCLNRAGWTAAQRQVGCFSSFPFLWSKVYATFHRMYDKLVGEAGMPGPASKRLCPCVRSCARTRSASQPSTLQPQRRTTWASASAPASATAFPLRRSAPQYVQLSVGCFKIYGFVLKLCSCSIAAGPLPT